MSLLLLLRPQPVTPAIVVVGRFDGPTPSGGFDEGSPSGGFDVGSPRSGRYDPPSPG